MKAAKLTPVDRIKRISLLDPERGRLWTEAGVQAKLKAYSVAHELIELSEAAAQKRFCLNDVKGDINRFDTDTFFKAYLDAVIIKIQVRAQEDASVVLEIEFIGGKYHRHTVEVSVQRSGQVKRVKEYAREQ